MTIAYVCITMTVSGVTHGPAYKQGLCGGKYLCTHISLCVSSIAELSMPYYPIHVQHDRDSEIV